MNKTNRQKKHQEKRSYTTRLVTRWSKWTQMRFDTCLQHTHTALGFWRRVTKTPSEPWNQYQKSSQTTSSHISCAYLIIYICFKCVFWSICLPFYRCMSLCSPVHRYTSSCISRKCSLFRSFIVESIHFPFSRFDFLKKTLTSLSIICIRMPWYMCQCVVLLKLVIAIDWRCLFSFLFSSLRLV